MSMEVFNVAVTFEGKVTWTTRGVYNTICENALATEESNAESVRKLLFFNYSFLHLSILFTEL